MKKLRAAPTLVFVLIFGLYFLKLIPPVPLSVQYVGVFREAEKVDGHYKLSYRKPPLMRFWQKSERTYLARPGDVLYCFIRVFAPSRFEHRVFVRWSQYDERKETWVSSDRIAMPIKGGRAAGYRGFTSKVNFSPGRWRVEVETEDERVLAGRDFRVREDGGTEAYDLKALWM